MLMLMKRLLMAFAFVACTSACFAQDHPNFTGTWKLDSSKSQLSDFGPSARTDVITQDGSKFTEKVTLSNQMGDSNYTLTFTADGQKQTFPSPVSMGMLSLNDITATWDGAQLIVKITASVQDQTVPEKDTYQLSSDGKTLTISQQSSTPMGEIDSKLVFDKQ